MASVETEVGDLGRRRCGGGLGIFHSVCHFMDETMKKASNKSLQATGAARSVLDGVGDSLLPGFVAASLPAPVPELWRRPSISMRARKKPKNIIARSTTLKDSKGRTRVYIDADDDCTVIAL